MAEQGSGGPGSWGWLGASGVPLRLLLLLVLVLLGVAALAAGEWLSLCIAIGLSGSVALEAADRAIAFDPALARPWRRVRPVVDVGTWCAIAAAAVLFVHGLFAD